MINKSVVQTLKYLIGIRTVSCRFATLLCSLLLLLSPAVYAQKDTGPTGDDEIVVSVEVRGLGSIEIPALYFGNDIYLSVPNVFDFLKIKNTPTADYDTVTGYFINQDDVFLIDKQHNNIQYRGKTFSLKPTDMARTDANLFLKLDDFKTVFNIDGVFNFRRLMVSLSSTIEFPAMREIKQDLMRHNVNHLKGDEKADTTIKRTYPVFHFGTADWAVISTQQSQGFDETRLNLGLGAVIAGGQADASLNLYNNQYNSEKNQFYQWHYVDNDNAVLRQVAAGKIFTQATASLYAPVVGVQFSNTPTIYRRAYGTYTLSNNTEPGWIVELYVNEVLVDYKKADASGFFSFEVPLVYGNSVVKLKFYGPYGEERVSQQNISVPFNFLPAKELEYTANLGFVEDGQNSRFTRETINYGLSNHITIGGGYEYLSSVTSGPSMPFISTSLRLAQRILLSGEYTDGVRSREVLSYRLPNNLQIDLDNTDYVKGQTAIYYNYLAERKAVFSLPIRTLGTSIFTRVTVDDIILPNTQYTNLEWAFSGVIHNVGLNFTTYASLTQQTNPYTYSVLSAAFQLPKKISFSAQVQYDFKTNQTDFVKLTLERHLLGHGYANVSFQDYFTSNNTNILVGMRYDFSFARVAFSALAGSNNTYSRVESASGSLVKDGKTGYLRADSRSNVGRAGIVVEPFLDLNCNGKKDPGEPKASGLKIRVNGGRIVYDKDSSIRVFDLEPYTSYYVELDGSAFDDISWQLVKHSYKVAVVANDFALVEVPIAVMGEASGMVYVKKTKGTHGAGQLIVDIYDTSAVKVARTITEPDGYFTYLGLPPGNYYAMVDSEQLARLGMVARPNRIPMSFNSARAGTVIDGLQFTLATAKDIADSIAAKNNSNLKATTDTANKDLADATTEDSTSGMEVTGNTKPTHHTGIARDPKTGKQIAKNNDEPNWEDRKNIKNNIITEKKAANTSATTTDSTGAANEQPYVGTLLAEKGSYAVQVGAFADIDNAITVDAKLKGKFARPTVIVQRNDFYKVRIVGFKTEQDARLIIPKLAREGYAHPWVLKLSDRIVQ